MTADPRPGSELTEADRAMLLAWAAAADWKFKSYYKYRFTFIASGSIPWLPPYAVPFTGTASVGGDAGDIYRFEVSDPMTWDGICSAGEPYLKLTDLGGNVFYEG